MNVTKPSHLFTLAFAAAAGWVIGRDFGYEVVGIQDTLARRFAEYLSPRPPYPEGDL